MIPLFEKLSFKEKIDILVELFLILEHDELLPDHIDNGFPTKGNAKLIKNIK